MTIVLDNIRSAFNVGSVMRSCDATGSKLVTVGYTPRPLGETRTLIKKTAINAETVVDFTHFDHANEVFEAYPKGIHIAVELFEDAINIYDFLERYNYEGEGEEVFLWLGNEIHGISENDKSKFNHLIYLPMVGIKESLNVANTSTTIMYLFKTLETKKIIKR